MMAVFRIFRPNTFFGFPGSAKEVTPRSRGKTVTTKGSHLQLEECMTSLVSFVAATHYDSWFVLPRSPGGGGGGTLIKSG